MATKSGKLDKGVRQGTSQSQVDGSMANS